MNDPMRILKADHREVEKLLTRLAETEEGEERESLAAEVGTKLRAHMEMEEQFLYPLVAEQVGPDDEEEASIEHGLAREGLEKAMGMLEAPGFGAVVEMLKGGITHHVEEEETEILPALKESLSRDEWTALGDQFAQAKQAAGLPLPSPPRRRSSKRRAGARGRSRK
jgi:hemerythrin-like domain-containing protein